MFLSSQRQRTDFDADPFLFGEGFDAVTAATAPDAAHAVTANGRERIALKRMHADMHRTAAQLPRGGESGVFGRWALSTGRVPAQNEGETIVKQSSNP